MNHQPRTARGRNTARGLSHEDFSPIAGTVPPCEKAKLSIKSGKDVLFRPKIILLSKCLAGLLAVLSLWTRVEARTAVTLAWDPVTTSPVAGYRVYFGGISRAYTNATTMGNVTQGTVSNLAAGVTYFFSATAYTSNALESDFSD